MKIEVVDKRIGIRCKECGTEFINENNPVGEDVQIAYAKHAKKEHGKFPGVEIVYTYHIVDTDVVSKIAKD